ncbi:MAG: penicillin acylase family protein [Caldilineaceae bacterium]
MRKTLGRILVVLLVLLVLVLAGGWLYLRTSLPQTTGALKLEGPNGAIDIVRDKDGVPHIFATTDHDAYFALGYVHAQDRLWQMEFQRRVGAGHLSEVLGEATLDTDKFLRTLGVYRAAEAAWPALRPESQAALQAYTDGINAWLSQRHTLPPEFLILGFTPERWTTTDSLVWAKMMAWDLAGDYKLELLRARLIQAIGLERTMQLMPIYPKNGLTILASAQVAPATADALLHLDDVVHASLQLGGLDIGSNNWVVAGSRTASGKPLLANDPHLGSRIPSIWYLAELQGDKLHVTGATLPGLPGVVIGHNERIAWGVTNLGADVQDLYIEHINPADPNQYEVEGRWENMGIVDDPIYIKGKGKPIRWAARSTRHGPLISDVTDTATPMALRWTALDPSDTTFDTFLGINYAANWEEFHNAFRTFFGPSQNFIYADIDGNIGYIGPGRIPIRAADDAGLLPVSGWDSRHEWNGWIPFDKLPQTYNPSNGYIVTANNRVVDEKYPYVLSNDWAPPFRAQRIADLIQQMSSGGEKLSVASMQAIQADQTSAQVQVLLPLLLKIEPVGDREKQAFTYLQAWKGDTGRDSIATTIYETWFIYLGRAMFADDLRGDLYKEMADRSHPLFLTDVMADPDKNAAWCDNVLTAPVETCADTARQALDDVLDALTQRLGKNMSQWQWGKVHITQYPHSPFSQVPVLNWLFDRSIANGGDKYTINVAPVDLSNLYNQATVPSYRQIVDLADLAKSVFMHTTGQSGNPLSAHYADLIERHRDVQYLPMSFGRDGVSGDVLRLEPR